MNGNRNSQLQRLVVKLKGVKSVVVMSKVVRPFQVKDTGVGWSKCSRFLYVASDRIELQAVTKKEAKGLRQLRYPIIASEYRVKGLADTAKLTPFDGVSCENGKVNRKKSIVRCSVSIVRRGSGASFSCRGGANFACRGDGGGSGPLDIDFGGRDISFCESGAGRIAVISERRFLAPILMEIERQKTILDRWSSEIRTRMRQLPDDDNDTINDDTPKKKIKPVFNEYVNEDHMASAMSEVFEHYRSKKLFNKDFKPIDLIAYLFVMVAIYGYGRMDFRLNAQKPFFDFFKKKVVPDLESTRGNTRESMGNRLRGKMKWLFSGSTAKNQLPPNKRLEADRTEKEFLEVYGNFHKTRYGTILKRQLGK